jgi:hypothetical protein
VRRDIRNTDPFSQVNNSVKDPSQANINKRGMGGYGGPVSDSPL